MYRQLLTVGISVKLFRNTYLIINKTKEKTTPLTKFPAIDTMLMRIRAWEHLITFCEQVSTCENLTSKSSKAQFCEHFKILRYHSIPLVNLS